MRKTIKVLSGGQVQPDPADVNAGDQISWAPDDGKRKFKVDFPVNKSPFKDGKNHFDQGDSNGDTDGNCQKAEYKYTVTADGVTNDPIIIVH